jgi:DNA-binding transcriptional ArsR family regulator
MEGRNRPEALNIYKFLLILMKTKIISAKIISALADKTRFRLFEKISNGEMCACALPPYAKVSQPAVSQHLKILLDAGLVQVRRDGVKRLYSLSALGKKVMRDISRW